MLVQMGAETQELIEGTEQIHTVCFHGCSAEGGFLALPSKAAII